VTKIYPHNDKKMPQLGIKCIENGVLLIIASIFIYSCTNSQLVMTRPEYVLSVDCRKMSCPLPILKTKKAIGTIEIGQILEMVATDPGSVADMKAWSRQTGHELVYRDEQDKDYFFYVKRTK
jgi:TusA-related sulfurtransferase